MYINSLSLYISLHRLWRLSKIPKRDKINIAVIDGFYFIIAATPVRFTTCTVATILPSLSRLEKSLFSETQLVYVNSSVCCIASTTKELLRKQLFIFLRLHTFCSIDHRYWKGAVASRSALIDRASNSYLSAVNLHLTCKNSTVWLLTLKKVAASQQLLAFSAVYGPRPFLVWLLNAGTNLGTFRDRDNCRWLTARNAVVMLPL